MSEPDLDIKNYDYEDLLALFSINNIDDRDFTIKIDNKLKQIKNIAPEYFNFYNKTSKLLISVLTIYKNNNVFNSDIGNDKYNYIINKITNLDNFDKYNTESIIKKLNLNSFNLNSNRSLIEQTKTNIINNTYPNDVAPGTLNSIKRITQFLNLNLNSCFRNDYFNSNPCDFQYNIPTEIKNVVSLRLASIEIPNAWYLFSSTKKNNTFIVEISNNNTITEYPITVPDGNYDNTMLENYLNTTYFNLSPTITDLNYIKFSIDQYNFKSKFELLSTAPKNFCFTLKFFQNTYDVNYMNTFGWIIGYRLAKYKNINTFIISEGLFDAGGDRYIYVCLEDYQYNNNTLNIVCFDNSIMEKNIIAKIPMINGKLSMIVDDNTCPLTKTRKYNGPVNISKLHIKILDNFGCVIDLNNMDFSFTIEFEILYEGFNFNNINY